jgi:hypothetical protein
LSPLNSYQFQYLALSLYYVMAVMFIIMTKKLHAALMVFLLIGILQVFGSGLPASEPCVVTRDSSSTTILGMSTGNVTPEELLASLPGGSNSSGPANATPANNAFYFQSPSGETNATAVDAVHFSAADGEVYSSMTRQEESDSLSGARMQLVLVLLLTALLFLISQVPSGKKPHMFGIHR